MNLYPLISRWWSLNSFSLSLLFHSLTKRIQFTHGQARPINSCFTENESDWGFIQSFIKTDCLPLPEPNWIEKRALAFIHTDRKIQSFFFLSFFLPVFVAHFTYFFILTTPKSKSPHVYVSKSTPFLLNISLDNSHIFSDHVHVEITSLFSVFHSSHMTYIFWITGKKIIHQARRGLLDNISDQTASWTPRKAANKSRKQL